MDAAPASSCSSVTPRQRGVRAGGAALQVHVAHRQRHDGDARPAPGGPSCARRRRRAGSTSEQQWPTRMLPLKPCRIAMWAISIEAAPGSPLSSTWKSRSRPALEASRKIASSTAGSSGQRIGDAADGLAAAAQPSPPIVGQYGLLPSARSMREQRRRLQRRCGRPNVAQLAEDRPGDAVCGRSGCRDACGWRPCRAHRRSAARTPCAPATSSADQRRRGRRRRR